MTWIIIVVIVWFIKSLGGPVHIFVRVRNFYVISMIPKTFFASTPSIVFDTMQKPRKHSDKFFYKLQKMFYEFPPNSHGVENPHLNMTKRFKIEKIPWQVV